jgi:hypothetical protein
MQALIIISTVLSGILSIIRVLDFVKERYRIKVKVKGNMLVADGRPIDNNNRFLIITIVNIGKEPVTIKSVGLMSPNDKSFLLFKDSIKNIKLNTSESSDYLMPEKNISFDRNKYVACAVDSTGKTHYSHGLIKRYLRLKRIK